MPWLHLIKVSSWMVDDECRGRDGFHYPLRNPFAQDLEQLLSLLESNMGDDDGWRMT